MCVVMYSSDSQWQTFTVPDGVASITIEASGAYGGGFCDQYDGGGAPGAANGTLAVTSGEVVKVFVGFQGTNASLNLGGSNCDTGNGAGGYGGGGRGGFSGSYGAGFDGAAGGGGGASVVTANGMLELVAGGGGGTGQGGEAQGNLPGTTYGGRSGSGGAGGGGVNRTTGNSNGTASGFTGQGVGGICECDDSGADGGTLTGPGAGGKAGMTYSGAPLTNGTTYATASAGHDGSGPATTGGAADGGQGAGDAKACRFDETNTTPAIAFSEGGGGGGGYYGGGGGGCGLEGGGGGGGGSSYVAPYMTSTSFANVVNPPVADNDPSLGGGYYSNTTSGLVTVAYPTCTMSNSSANLRSHADLEHAEAGSCPLTVAVTTQGPSRSGLAIDNDEPNYGPINFTAETNNTKFTEPVSAGQRCESGCTNVLITVTDPKTKKPVTDATVEAKVSLTGAPERTFGTEFICEQSVATVPKCGTDLQNLSTDAKGQVHLLYWAPGFVPDDTSSDLVASIDATAKETCAPSSCPAKEREGTGALSVATQPYVIYHAKGQLSAAQVKVLIDLSTEHSITIDPADTLALHQMTEPAVEFLEATEREGLANLARLPAAYGEAIVEVVEMGQAIAAYGKAAPLMVIFLKALNLSPIGINDPPFKKSAAGSGTDAFMNLIGGGLGSFSPLAQKWTLARDGEALAEQMRQTPSVFATPPENIDLKVYEVSHCDDSNPNCGPGYSGSTGIEPEICFSFEGSDRIPSPKLDWNYVFCAKTYDPVAWVESQQGINTALPKA
jgi:hypothetical protein